MNEPVEIRVRHPGEILRELLRHKNMKQGELADIIGRPRQAVCETINGKRGVTPAMAKALAVVYQDDPIFGHPMGWLQQQNAWRLARLTA